MKGRTLTFLGILAAVIAAALIIARNHITPEGVVLTGGILFIIAGISNTIAISRNRASQMGRMFGYMANAASIVLGICMIVFQESFVPLVSFIFGLLVAMFAVWQFYVLAAGCRPYRLAAWLYVFPIALTAIAAYILLTKASLQEMPIMLSTGIAVAVVALGCIVEGGMLGAARHLAVKEGKRRQEAEADVAETRPRAETPQSETAAAPTENKPAQTSGSEERASSEEKEEKARQMLQ